LRVQIPAKAKFAPLVRTSVTLAYRYERPRLHANANVDQKCSVYGPTLEKRENEKKSSGPGENCQRNVTDLAGSLVTSCRPPGRLQKGPDDRTWNAGVAVRTADGSRRTADAGDEQCLSVDVAVRYVLWCGVTCHPADAGDEQCLRCGCSSPSCTVVR